MAFPLRVVLAFALLFAGFAVVCPQLAEKFGQDFWNRFSGETPAGHGMQEEALEGVKLSQQRQEMRHIVIQELVEERMNLSDAVGHFYELDQAEPEIMVQTLRRFPAETEWMSVGLQVISHANAYLQNQPSRSAEVSQRLKTELMAMTFVESPAIH